MAFLDHYSFVFTLLLFAKLCWKLLTFKKSFFFFTRKHSINVNIASWCCQCTSRYKAGSFQVSHRKDHRSVFTIKISKITVKNSNFFSNCPFLPLKVKHFVWINRQKWLNTRKITSIHVEQDAKRFSKEASIKCETVEYGWILKNVKEHVSSWVPWSFRMFLHYWCPQVWALSQEHTPISGFKRRCRDNGNRLVKILLVGSGIWGAEAILPEMHQNYWFSISSHVLTDGGRG